MKIKSIKVSIMWNLFLSLLLAAFATGITCLLFFGILEFGSQEMYKKVLALCYATMTSMILTSMAIMVLYLFYFILIFLFQLNEITDTIKKISINIHKLAQGDFREKLFVKSDHELGVLANDINQMSDKIDAYIKNEQKWNEERYHLITNMSHDLKTPIMSISGYIQLLQSGNYSDENERYRYGQIIAKKTEELSDAINQLFELSKLNSNSLKLNRVDIRLKEFMEQVIVSYIPVLEREKMDVRIGISGDLLVSVDLGLMKRVFENIISNGIKYGSSGVYLDITGEEKDNQVTVHFINYGPMIVAEDLEHIFDRYYRANKNLGHEGSGLGLAIAKTIMQLHGGEIQVSSTMEKTDFSIVLNREIT